jgi:integrase/recombinase XerC
MAFLHYRKAYQSWYLVDKAFTPPKWIKLGQIKQGEARKVLARYETETTYLKLDMSHDSEVTVRELVDRYLEDQSRANTKQPYTLRIEKFYLDKFSETFGKQPARTLTTEEVQAWFKKQKYKPNTIRLYCVALRGAFKLAVDKKFLSKNIILEIRRPRLERLPPKHVDPKLLKRIFKTMTEEERSPYLLLYYTGMRPSEVLRLQAKDIDLKQESIVVRKSKTKAYRILPIHPEIMNPLKRLLKKKKTSDPVLTPISFRNGLRRALKTLKLPENSVTQYQFRHTFATEVLEKTGDIRLVQQLLGHASIQTTTIYATALDKRLKEAVGKL